MKIAVLGSGVVGETLASRLVEVGHEVRMGSRTANNEKAAAWVAKSGPRAGQGTFAAVSAWAELVISAVHGEATLAALRSTGAESLAGKVLVDVANRLDFSKGMPPVSGAHDGDSLAEQIQREFPRARVVKSLNTMNCRIMVAPQLVPGDHDVFLSGNDAAAKDVVRGILRQFGWPDANILDLGDVTTARGPENMMPMWIRVWGAFGNVPFNVHWVRAKA
ncbi:MAG TPA: NAD(P)-binding domain-containing protein [Candidatus Acidoferrales bacterium]|nr:NAD(P)-binding domain-containing protein [Candidatus Acidoferrales bacterium]